MMKRTLGKSGIEVAPLALGGNVFGWTLDSAGSFRILDAFLSRGFNLIDTADVYSTWAAGNHGGESETIIGDWMKKRKNRSGVVLATKVGKPMGPEKKGLSRKYILQAVEDSLHRLQTDYIDLYQCHDDDPATPMEETLDCFSQLIRSGKVRAIGASNFSAPRFAEALRLSEAYGYPRYEVIQPAYNLIDRNFEKDYQALCIREGIGVISYYALASGFLTGKYRSEKDLTQSARGPGIRKYLNPRGLRILAALDELSIQMKTSPASLAIAWILANPAITAPIASATRLAQLDEILDATKLVLPVEAINRLNEASRKDPEQ